MRATLTAVIAAIEAGAVALAGFVLIGVPAILMWVITFGLDATPAELIGGIVSVWFLAHGVPLEVSVTAEAALGLGLPGEAFAFPVSLAPLGISLVTVLLAMRAGWRFASRGGSGAAGVIGGGLGFAAVGFACLPLVARALPEPEWRAPLTLGLIYAISMLSAFVVRAGLTDQRWFSRAVRRLQLMVNRVSPILASTLPVRTQEVLRLALGALAGLAALAAAGFTISLVIGYVDITALSQNLQLDPLGAIVLFVVQLAFLPVALIWSLSWFVGTGFAVGIGTSVSPFDALVGPIPALPLMGAIPPSWGSFAPVAPAIVVIVGLALGVAAARRTTLRGAGWGAAVVVPVLAAALTGLAVVLLAVLASGAMGPDRFAQAGPDPWVTGGIAAAEIGAGMLLGVVAGRADAARIGTVVELVRGGERRALTSRNADTDAETQPWSSDALAAAITDDADGPLANADRAPGVRARWAGARERLTGFLGFGGATAGTGAAQADALPELPPVDEEPETPDHAPDGPGHAAVDADEREPDEFETAEVTTEEVEPEAVESEGVEPEAVESEAVEADETRTDHSETDEPASDEPAPDATAPDEPDLPERLDDVTEDELRVSDSEAEAILAAFSWDGAVTDWEEAPRDRLDGAAPREDSGTPADPEAQETAQVDGFTDWDSPDDAPRPEAGTGRRVWRWPGRKR